MVGFAEEREFAADLRRVEGAAELTLGDDSVFLVDDAFPGGGRRGGGDGFEEEVVGGCAYFG